MVERLVRQVLSLPFRVQRLGQETMQSGVWRYRVGRNQGQDWEKLLGKPSLKKSSLNSANAQISVTPPPIVRALKEHFFGGVK